MRTLKGLRARLRALIFRRAADHDLREEVQFHIDMETDQLMREGVPPREARRRAYVRFGGVERHIEEVRASRPDQWLVDAGSDLRHALRWLRREPRFVVVAVVCLGLGIGANTTIFSVVDALLFRAPSGVADSGSLVRVRLADSGASRGARRIEPGAITYPDFVAVRDGARPFAGVAAFAREPVTLLFGTEAAGLTAGMVSGSYFQVLGVRPALGRLLAPGDDVGPASAPVAVLSYAFWHDRFGGAPDIVGRLITLNGIPVQVVGVSARDFSGVNPGQPDVWLPLGLAASQAFGGPERLTRGVGWLSLIARLKPGYKRSAVLHGPPLSAPAPEGEAGNLILTLAPPTLAAASVRGHPALPLWVIGVALTVLLVACGTVGTLLLARAARREREVGTRMALGAARGRLVRQLLTESLVLAFLGGGAALLLARVGIRVARLLPIPPLSHPLDLRAILLTGLLAVLATVLAGLAPALWAVRRDPAAGLASGGLRLVGGRSRLRGTLMVFQLTLSFVLLVGAGLFLRSLRNVRATDVGFDVDSLVIIQPHFPRGYPAGAAAAVVHRVSDRLSRLPEVRSVAYGVSAPWGVMLFFTIEAPDAGATGAGTVMLNGDRVSGGYFRTMGIHILRGRALGTQDRAGSESVVVISAALARRLWPGAKAVGRCLHLVGAGGDSDCLRVVGVAADARYDGVLESAPPYIYLPAAQPLPGLKATAVAPRVILVKTRGDVAAAAGAVRHEMLSVDASLARSDVRTMAELMRPQLEPWIVAGTLFSTFGVLALVLAAVGLYVVTASLVVQRQRELGIRRALGADAGSISGLLYRHALKLTALGVSAGAPIAALGGRLLASQLYGVGSLDPLTYVSIALLLTVAALLACVLPARRAVSVDPIVVLRAE